MDISKVINEKRIKLNMSATTKQEAIEELSELLLEDGAILDKDQFIKDVFEREKMGATGLSNHIAIPHGKSAAVAKTALAIGRTNNDIPWETLDGQPVRCVILFAVRLEDKNTTHVKLLAQVAGALADDETLKKLLVVEDKKELIKLFTKKD